MSPLLRFFPLVVLLALSAPGQELNEKAARYYETLRKRPAPGPVFDRFVDAWLDTGTLEQLESYLTEKVKAEPSAAGHLLLGLYQVRQGAHAKAVEQYRAALMLEPDNAALWQQKAMAEARLLEFDQAIASLEKGLEKKPAEELSLAMRQLQGRLLSRAGRTGDALVVWQKLMTERPDDEALREDVLELQLAENLYDAAVENAAALVEHAPDAYKKAMRRLQSAEVLDRAGRTDAAMAELEKCLADSGTDSWLEKEVLARLDRIFRRDDNLSGLRAHLEALTSRQPLRHGLARARVRLLAELGEKSAAVESGRALLALAPGDRAARDEFIALLVEAGRLDEAVAQTAELVRQAPQDRELLLRLATLKLQAGDKPGCLAAVAEYDRLSGADEAARLRSAALLEKAGLAEEAIARLKAAAKEFPESAAVSGALASSLHKAKHREEALAEWKRQAAAVSGPALQDVARALSAHGEDEAAWELLAVKAAAGDAPLLTQLCQLAERLERADEALPHARRLVGMAQSAPDMEAALELASRLIKRAGQADDVIASINKDAGVADLCLLAELLEMRGDSSAAEEALGRAAQASPELAAAQLVRLYRLRQAWPQALEAGAKLFAAPGGKKAATAQSLADMAEHARDLEAALKWTREWRKLSPGAAPAVLAEARLLRAMGKDEEALKSLRLASGQFEENKEIREELARLSRDLGHTSEALSLYAGLYEQAPDATQKLRIIHEWAEAAQEANRLPELLEQFDERRRQNRNATGPLLALAEIHSVNGDREKQRRALTDATRLRPEDADLALMLASMQEEDALIPLALDTLRAALPHDKSGRVRQRLARIHFNAGDQEAGMKLLDEPADGTPPDAAAVESMALALSEGDPGRALALLVPRIAADPADYRLRFLRASLLAELGQHEEAVREWAALLAIRQESPAVTARRGSSVFSPETEGQLKRFAGTVPEEILDVLRARDLARQNSRQQRSSRYASAVVQPRLPGTLAELRALTATALLTAGADDKERQKEADGILERQGLSELRGMQVDVSGDEFAPGIPLPRNDGKMGAGYLVVTSLTGNAKEAPDPALCSKVWQEWQTTHPDFALAAAIAGLHDSPVLLQDERAAVELFLQQERPHDLVLRGAVRYLQQGGVRRADDGKTHRAILERIISWLESDWIAAPALLEVRRYLAQNLVERLIDEPVSVARIFNAEWAREEHGGKRGAISAPGLTNYNFFAAQSGSLLTPLTWPPVELPGVSPLFAGEGGSADLAGRLSAGDAGKVAPLVKSPVLRAWLEDRATDAGHPLPALTKLASDANAEPAALVLAAASAAEAEKYTEAAQLAARALERPLSGEMRRKLNASIVSWADESMAEQGAPLHTAAREAALRLRRDAQTLEEKAELAEAMESLGLTTEAATLKSGGMPGGWMNNNLANYLRNERGGSRLQLLLREARQELTSGDKNAAVTTAKVLRMQARHLLSPAGWDGEYGVTPPGRYFSGSTEDDVKWPDFLKLLREKKTLEEPILAALTAAAGSEPRQRAVLAAAHEFFDRTERAVELYREVIAAGSTDPGVRVRLVRLLHGTRREKEAGPLIYQRALTNEEVTRLFCGAPPNAQSWLMHYMLPLGGREPLDAVLSRMPMVEAALEKRDPASPDPAEWLSRFATLLREDLLLTGNLRAAHLEGPTDGEPMLRPDRAGAGAEEMQQAKEKLATRRAAHERLCRKLLSVPGSAALAFQYLRSASRPDADLTAEAVSAVVTESGNAAAMSGGTGALQQQALRRQALAVVQRSDGTDGFALVAPPVVDEGGAMQYLLASCVKQNAPGALRDALIPALQKAGAAKLAEQTMLLTALYFDAADQVEANARRLVAAGGAAVWPAVVRGLEHRHAPADLAALVVAELSRTRSRPDDLPLMTAAAGDYCAWLCREGRHAQARALLERVLDVLTGSARQRAAAFSTALAGGMNRYLNALTGSGRVIGSSPAVEAMELLKRLISTPATTFIALDTVYESIMPALPPDMASGLAAQLDVLNAPFTKPEFFKDAERARQFFTNSPLVAEVEQFRSYGGGTGLFFTVAGVLYEMGFEERKPALAVLRALPPAFGRDVLIASASDRWSCEALNAAAERFVRIKALPPPVQAEVSDLLAGLASGRDTVNLTDAGQGMMKWVREQQSLMMGEETGKKIETFVTAKVSMGGGGSFGNDPAALGAQLLEAAIKAMSPRAYDVVRRVSVLVPRHEAPAAMGGLLAGYGSHYAPMIEVAGRNLVDGMLPLPPDRAAFRLGLLTNTLCAGDKRAPLFIEPLRLALPRTVRWITDKLTGSTEERLTALTTALAAQVKEGEACVLLEAFPMPVTNDDTPEGRAAMRAATITWAGGAGKSLPRQDIVQEIAAAARLEQCMETQPHAAGIADEAALPPEQAHYLAVMRDESRGPAARLAVASLLADFAGPWLEPPLVAQVAGILERTLTSRRPLEGWQREAILLVISRSAPSPLTDAAANSLLMRLPFDTSLKEDSDRAEAKNYLALALRVNDSGAVVKSLAALQVDGGDPDVLGLVLASGDAVRVASIVRDAETKFYYPALIGGRVQFDQRTAVALAGALPGLSDEAARFRLELAANSLPSAQGMKPRVERMQEIASRMKPLIERLSGTSRIDLLDLLTVEPAAALPFQKLFAQECQEKSWKEILELNPREASNFSPRFWMTSLFAVAAAGDVGELTKRMDVFLKSKAATDPFASGADSASLPAQSALHHLCTGIAHGWPQWDATQRAAVQQWIIGRMKAETLPGVDSAGDELSLLPKELIEAINAEVK